MLSGVLFQSHADTFIFKDSLNRTTRPPANMWADSATARLQSGKGTMLSVSLLSRVEFLFPLLFSLFMVIATDIFLQFCGMKLCQVLQWWTGR